MTDLKPCPFCSGEAKISLDHTVEENHAYGCPKCNIWFDTFNSENAEAEWNTRAALEAPPDALALVAAAYRDAAEQCRKEERRREHQCTQVRSGKVNVHIDQLRRWEGGKVQADMLAETVHARTPADAEAHLTALLRAEYERGVREAAAVSRGRGFPDGFSLPDHPFDRGYQRGIDECTKHIIALLTQDGR